MEICEKCGREFPNKISLHNHTRYIKKYGQCESYRTSEKICPNPQNNEKCKQVYVFSKSGLCKSCSSKLNFNDVRTGKTYEELYGEDKALQLKLEQSIRSKEWNANNPDFFKGENNPNFGKVCVNKGKSWEEIHGEERATQLRNEYSIRSFEFSKTDIGKKSTEKLILAAKDLKNRISLYDKWVRKYGVETANEKYKLYLEKLSIALKSYVSTSDFTGENNSRIKHLLKKFNLTYDEYIQGKTEYECYKFKVIQITNEQPIQILENHDKRGKTGVDGAYHLDHIYSIRLGFLNNIDPHVIGHISNLRFIPWLENIQKSAIETDESWDMFQYFIDNDMV